MPWLLKPDDRTKYDEHLLFIHVPRCGGTSLTQHFDVPAKVKAEKDRTWWGKIGMTYFFHRYHVLETANFPIKTKESVAALFLFVLGCAMLAFGTAAQLAKLIVIASVVLFVAPAFLFTAPFIGRLTWVRRPYLYLVHYVLCQFMESIEWLTGTNKTGYMMHLTARKLLAYGYITPEEMDNVCSMAIVRNPYSRMVSVYMYNRFGSGESFPQFVRSWYYMMRFYRESGETEEWWTPCHCIPQVDFTHFEGKQLVQSIVKQEELKFLKREEDLGLAVANDSSVKDLPDLVRSALLGMPHTNSRKSNKKWYEYFDQETMNMTYEMYKADFEAFGYPAEIEQRPDLVSPAPKLVEPTVEKLRRNSAVVNGRRVSKLLLFQNASNRALSVRTSGLRSSVLASPTSGVSESTMLLQSVTEEK